jgi:hypothetical protein
MVSDELGMQLHDRDTLGEPLTTQEQAQLAEWYAAKDAAEAAMFAASQPAPLPNLVALETQVDQAIADVALSAQRLQQITVENKFLRGEITGLKQHHAHGRTIRSSRSCRPQPINMPHHDRHEFAIKDKSRSRPV